jgi:hypothetical protein
MIIKLPKPKEERREKLICTQLSESSFIVYDAVI